MTSSTGRPSTPPLAFTSSRHISSAVLITLLGAAPAPVNARLSPILIGWPLCADALDKVTVAIAIAVPADRIACKHQVHIASSSFVLLGTRPAASFLVTRVVCGDLLFYTASSTKRLRIFPKVSISVSTISPEARNVLVPCPTPPQVPQLNTSPASRVSMFEAY